VLKEFKVLKESRVRQVQFPDLKEHRVFKELLEEEVVVVLKKLK
jgi:hypothetical protein